MLFRQQYKKYMEELTKDQIKLTPLRNADRKVKKMELIKKYQPYIDAWTASASTEPNLVFSWFVVWLADIEAIEEFIHYSLIGLEKNQTTPKEYRQSSGWGKKPLFKTNLAEFFHYGVMSWSLDQIKNQNTPRPFFDMAYARICDSLDYIKESLAGKMHVTQAKICFLREYQNAAGAKEAKKCLIQGLRATRWAQKVHRKAQCKTLQNKIVQEMRKKEWLGLWDKPEAFPPL